MAIKTAPYCGCHNIKVSDISKDTEQLAHVDPEKMIPLPPHMTIRTGFRNSNR